MNKSLNALMTKLTWQQNDLRMHLQEIENESIQVIQQLQELGQKLNQCSDPPSIINPEIEISRLNFITKQHEKQDELEMLLKNNRTIESKLKEKLQRVKTEIKMLEKYLERETKTQQVHLNKAQELSLDEWAIQKRELA